MQSTSYRGLMQPIRFGVQLNSPDPSQLGERIRRYEDFGISSIYAIDHIAYPQWSPLATLGAVSSLTKSAAVGSPALNVNLHHPLELARASSVLAAVAAGGCELGIGAGWLRDDWTILGRDLEPQGSRAARIEEAVTIIRSLWTQERTDHNGRFYRIEGATSAMSLPLPATPKIVLGHEYVDLELAGRHADIVSLWPFTARTIASADLQMRAWAKAATIEYLGELADVARNTATEAGRDADDLEFQIEVPVQVVSADESVLHRRLRALTTSGTTAFSIPDHEMLNTSIFLAGSPREVRDRILRQRDRIGLNYLILQRNAEVEDWEEFEQLVLDVVAPLTGR